jgi:hypothetical protein
MAKEKTKSQPKPVAKVQQEFWAFAKFHEPFTMGGDVWPRKKYKVLAEPTKIDTVDCFIFFDEKYSKQWYLYEATTGGCLQGGIDRAKLIAEVATLLADTPDFAAQVAAFGPPDKLEEIDTDEREDRDCCGRYHA